MALWINLALIAILVLVVFRSWGSEFGFSRLLWPPRMSSFLVFSGLAYYVYDCLSHPPFGYSRYSVGASCLLVALGFTCRKWET